MFNSNPDGSADMLVLMSWNNEFVIESEPSTGYKFPRLKYCRKFIRSAITIDCFKLSQLYWTESKPDEGISGSREAMTERKSY